MAVSDLGKTCASQLRASVKPIGIPGQMKIDSDEMLAFIEAPDGDEIELIEHH